MLNHEKGRTISQLLLNLFFKPTLHILSSTQFRGGMSGDARRLTFILQQLKYMLQYLLAFPQLGKRMLKTVTGIWSAPFQETDSSKQNKGTDYQSVYLHAYLCMNLVVFS